MQIHDVKPKQTRVFSVLHADSDLLMRKIISNVFSNEAFQLDSAANGKEAFALLEARDYQYDIIITEMHMQYANGYEIINKVMKESPRTRTIITSNMSYLHIREGLEIVREDCFKKPLVVGKLLERVKHIMGGDPEVIPAPEMCYKSTEVNQIRLETCDEAQELMDVPVSGNVQDIVNVQELAPVLELLAEQDFVHVQERLDAQEAVMSELFVAEFVAKEETLAIDVATEPHVLLAFEPKAQVTSGRRWW
ncbi:MULTISPECIES: response regulator [unclassified Sphingobacterium]|uniref:response regulator n=1 Tax=unclassified Sphingobacterium TaxID=2609468 RepID=UPI0025E3B5F2|nr:MULTISPECIES: response regulator [unclassified Sphingobacterium]